MGSPGRSYPLHGLIIKAVTVVFIGFLSILPPKSDGSVLLNTSNKNLGERKIGSKPPACVNKCMNCSPCVATLVLPNNDPKGKGFKMSSHGDDDTYYLLHWKCRCGNKLYQP